ncbi:MAG: putative porin [Bacteroidales bacterium]|nr:putative porin [Bacteroidales bacterium]
MILLFNLSGIYAQEDSVVVSPPTKNERIEEDSTRIMYSWKLTPDYLSKERTEIDTGIIGFQVSNPMYKWSYGNSFLGNAGSPVISDLFFHPAHKKMISTF